MIAILDYGMANLRSVQKAFEAIGAHAVITSDPKVDCDKLVLPGVGAIRDGMAKLNETGLGDTVRRHIDKGRPLLGICLGLQMLFERSHEDGLHDGLGILNGEVVRFTKQPGLKIPHMGWNRMEIRRPCPLFEGLSDQHVYFVHSYFAKPADDIIAGTTQYGGEFTSAVWKNNIFAVQFHPEKSQATGLVMLKNFSSL